MGKGYAIGIGTFALACMIGIYARIWEARQPVKELKGAIVELVESYHARNDLHWSADGYRVKIREEARVIDFSIGNWDKTVNQGDSVDMGVRESFPWTFQNPQLDGLYINDGK
jgi:hypothetical protein